MNINDAPSGKPNKNSLNLLAYLGKRTFDIRFFALYLLGGVVISTIVNFILDGGNVPAGSLWFSTSAGLVIGVVLYFWDLTQAKKQ